MTQSPLRHTDYSTKDDTNPYVKPGPLQGDYLLHLHTTMAQRIYRGRDGVPANKAKRTKAKVHIPGTNAFAKLAMQLTQASKNGDPYADWTLVQLDTLAVEIRDEMDVLEKEIQERGNRFPGITTRSLGSKQPAVYALKYASPYGYLSAQLVARADQIFLQIQNLLHTALIDRAESETKSARLYKLVRRFHSGIKTWRSTGATRKDFVPAMTARGQKAVELMGGKVPPPGVLDGSLAPALGNRRYTPAKVEEPADEGALDALDDEIDDQEGVATDQSVPHAALAATSPQTDPTSPDSPLGPITDRPAVQSYAAE